MSFQIGQVFEDSYPPEAAEWSNANNAHIIMEGGKFTIVAGQPESEQSEHAAIEY